MVKYIIVFPLFLSFIIYLWYINKLDYLFIIAICKLEYEWILIKRLVQLFMSSMVINTNKFIKFIKTNYIWLAISFTLLLIIFPIYLPLYSCYFNFTCTNRNINLINFVYIYNFCNITFIIYSLFIYNLINSYWLYITFVIFVIICININMNIEFIVHIYSLLICNINNTIFSLLTLILFCYNFIIHIIYPHLRLSIIYTLFLTSITFNYFNWFRNYISLLLFKTLSLQIVFYNFNFISIYTYGLFYYTLNYNINKFINILTSTQHIFIGLAYLTLGIFGGSIGFALSLLIRFELGLSGFIITSTLQYNSIITFHGLLMIFFMIMPILIGGFGNILLPLMLNCSDMIFPRLNATSLWLLFMSINLIILSIFIDSGINAGWTFYVPLSNFNSSSIDLMFFSLHIAGLSSLIGSINFMCTFLKLSSQYIKHSYLFIGLYPWTIFFTSLLLLISLPVLAAAITMIIFDRHFNSCFFDPLRGGDCILFQHLFWFFRHPEVYVSILPAFGLVSEILSKYTQTSIFGRDSMILALFLISFIGLIVWGHHMFMVGFDITTQAYYTTATSIIAIPTGIKIYNWIFTIHSSLYYINTSILFIIGFLFSFTFGGITGIILANCIIDSILHDTYFVIAHFHYVLSLGAVYSIFSAFYSYFNYFISITINDLLGKLHFITFFISSNIIFLPMHSLGLFGMPRRIFDYLIIYIRFNYFSSFAWLGIILSICCFILTIFI